MQNKTAFQDGADFYDAKTNKHIISYPDFVKNDRDIKGAIYARSHFLAKFPEYKMEN